MKKLHPLINKLRSRIKNWNQNRIFQNFLSLSALQGANILLPLITIPFLIRMIGIEKFGILGMAMALVAYFELLTDYGFDLSATRKISQSRKDPQQLNSIYNTIMTLKAGLSVISLFSMTALVLLIPVFREYAWIYFLTFGRVIGKSLFPVWFYQGIEEMRFITQFNLISKIIFAALIFIFIRGPEDFYLVPVLNSLGILVPGIFAPFHLQKNYGLTWIKPDLISLTEGLTDGFYIFLSRIYVNLYHSFNTLLLGFFTNYQTVGHYAVAAKVIEACSMSFIPANNALFPHLSRLWKENNERFYELIKKLKKLYLMAGSIMAVIALIFSRPIIKVVSGIIEEPPVIMLRILAFKLPFIALGPLYTSMFISQGRNRDYLWVVKNTFLINLSLVPVLIYVYSANGLALAVLFVALSHQLLFHLKRSDSTLTQSVFPITEKA